MRRLARWFSSCCRLVAAFEPLLICAVAPLLIFPRGPLPLAGLVAILGLWTARWIAHRRITVSTPLDLPMLLLLVMAIQSLYPSTDLALSMPKLYGIVLGVAIYYAVVNGVRSPRGWWAALGLLLAATVGVAAVGLVGTDWIHKIPGSSAFYNRLPRVITSVQSSFGTIAGIHPNEVGGTLAFLLPVPAGVILWSLRRGRQAARDSGTCTSPTAVEDRIPPSPTAVEDRIPPSPTAVEDRIPPSPTAVGEAQTCQRARLRGEGPRPDDQEHPLTPWTCPLAGPRLSHSPYLPLSASPRLPVPPSPALPVPPSPRPPALAAATLLLSTPVLGLTFSRSAFLGFGCALLLLVGLRWRWVGYGFVALAVVGAIALAVVGPQRVYDEIVRVDESIRTGGSTLESRKEVWNRASYMVQDFPFTGIGLNTFPKVLDALYPSFIAGPEASIPHAHNIYLQTAVDLGLAGLMAFLGLWAILFWQAVRAYQRAEGPTRGAIAGLGAGCLAYLIYGVTDAITLGAKPLFLLWIMVGLIVVAGRLLDTGTGGRGDGEMGRRGDGETRGHGDAGTRGHGDTGTGGRGDGETRGHGDAGTGAQGYGEMGNRQQAIAFSFQDSAPITQHPSLLVRIAREVGVTLWMLYWAIALLFAAMAYLVIGISISGWVP